MTPRLLAGTSGYSYEEWEDSFYPQSLPAARYLSYYAEFFRTVEINSTFYRAPKPEAARKWGEQVPADFVFAIKATRQITHQRKLADCAEPLRHLLAAAAVLGPKLGPILFQLPPFLKVDIPRLRDFLALLPASLRAAFEFRNPSWFCDAIYTTLADKGAALCVADFAEAHKDVPRVATASYGYLRLRDVAYDDAALRGWSAWIREQRWDDAYVYFKHEDAGIGPKLAGRLLELWQEA